MTLFPGLHLALETSINPYTRLKLKTHGEIWEKNREERERERERERYEKTGLKIMF
jgi:hypothetical protein